MSTEEQREEAFRRAFTDFIFAANELHRAWDAFISAGGDTSGEPVLNNDEYGRVFAEQSFDDWCFNLWDVLREKGV